MEKYDHGPIWETLALGKRSRTWIKRNVLKRKISVTIYAELGSD